MGRRRLADRRPARLPRPGRRRGPRLGPRDGRRRGARAAGQRPPRGRGARRRRLPDGRDGALDAPPATGCRCSSSSPTTAPSSTTRSTRSASPAPASGRSRTAGSGSRSATPTPTSPALAASLGLRGFGPVARAELGGTLRGRRSTAGGGRAPRAAGEAAVGRRSPCSPASTPAPPTPRRESDERRRPTRRWTSSSQPVLGEENQPEAGACSGSTCAAA